MKQRNCLHVHKYLKKQTLRLKEWIKTEAQDSHIQMPRSSYKLYQYLQENGTFDYNKYREIQIKGNKNKIDLIWVLEENICFLSNYIKTNIQQPRFGICHGTRRGKEQEWFRKYLKCEVIGTEISDTADQFPYTIQWDFHDVKPEWIESVDFIYSNSFDHSYDPQTCLNAWMSCLKKGGICILEHSSLHSPDASTELDPFGADTILMPYLITIWGDGKYGIRQIIESPQKNDKLANHFGVNIDYMHFIIIQKF
jgi:hypothetical protein